MIPGNQQTSKITAQNLEQLHNELLQGIEEAKNELLQLKQCKQYTKQIVQKIDAQNEIIQQNNYLLDEIKSCSQLAIGKWVKRLSQKDKQPGQIVDLKIQAGKPIVVIQWWQESATKSESPKNLQLLTPKDLLYNWNGSKFPKFVRNIDGFECEDPELLQSQLNQLEHHKELGTKADQSHRILDGYDRQIVYCKKRLALFKQKNIEQAEPEQIEQLTLNSISPNPSTEQIEILTRFAERKTESTIIAIDQITRDPKTQQREKLDLKVVEDYCEVFLTGAKLPPVKVKFDGSYYWLYDGFHTLRAAEQAGLTEISAQITPGNLRDAILESVGVNAEHGLRRSRETKRRAVTTLLTDPEWGQWSDNEIAKKCKVSQPFVSKLRKSLTYNVISDNHKNYKDKHGNLSKMNTAKIGKSASENAETDKLTNSTDNVNKSQSQPTPREFEPHQLVQLNFCSFDGVSEKLKLLNHSYGIITSKIEVGNGYNVTFFEPKHLGNCSYVLKTEDLKPVEQVSFTVTFEPREYIALMNIYGSKNDLYDAIKQSLTGVKPA